MPAFLLGLSLLAQTHAAPAKPAGPATPAAALLELRSGNARFVEGRRSRTLETARDPALRQALAKGQSPFAVIVTCADSRVPDALLFDQELGRLFTIREAGNAPDLQGIASVDYAVEHLGSKVVLVMGHGSCGAVKAVQEAGGKPLPGNLWAFQAAMAGLLETTPAKPDEAKEAHLARLVEANARRQAEALVARSEVVRSRVASGAVQVVPAVYDLASGKVSFLDPVGAPAPHEGDH